MDADVRILLIESDADHERSTTAALSRLPLPMPSVVRLSTAAEALALMSGQAFDLILAELDLPDSTGLDTCRALCAGARGAPIVALVGGDGDAIGMGAVRLGARDFLARREGHAHELWRMLEHASEGRQSRIALQQARQEALASSERARLCEQLIYTAVHDLRSPVFSMQIYLECLERDLGEGIPAESRADLARTRNIAANLVELVSVVQDIHRMEAGKMPMALATTDLRSVLADAVGQACAGGHQQRIGIDVPAIEIVCDAALMRRAASKILLDAMRTGPPERSLSLTAEASGALVEVRLAGQGQVLASRQQPGQSDPGDGTAGAAEALAPSLNARFCAQAIALHGGTMGVRGRPGAGRSWWFTLPVRPPST
jgi:K+-sensing histidine kinase KdpD